MEKFQALVLVAIFFVQSNSMLAPPKPRGPRRDVAAAGDAETQRGLAIIIKPASTATKDQMIAAIEKYDLAPGLKKIIVDDAAGLVLPGARPNPAIRKFPLIANKIDESLNGQGYLAFEGNSKLLNMDNERLRKRQGPFGPEVNEAFIEAAKAGRKAEIKAEIKAEAATKIQSAFRGRLARKEQAKRASAATKIQSVFRGGQARGDLQRQSSARPGGPRQTFELLGVPMTKTFYVARDPEDDQTTFDGVRVVDSPRGDSTSGQ